MKDLYKHLQLDETAPAEAIRSACATAQPELRSAAEFILLDEHRRRVYDRNRSLLTTVGQLRSRLGLTFAPFWSRGAFADFSFEPLLKFPTAEAARDGQHLADPLEVLRAFDGAQRRRKRRRPKAHYFLISLAVLILLATVWALIKLWWQSGQNVNL